MTSFTLKIIALILMVVDHIGNFFPQIEGVLYMRLIGRIVAPIFMYLLVEGFIYTKDRKKYANRLLLFGGIMSVGNWILMKLILIFAIPTQYSVSPLCPNIFLSMFLGLLILGDLEKIKMSSVKIVGGKAEYKKKVLISIVRLIICIVLSLFTEASWYGLLCIFVFYLFREKPILKILSYILGCVVICILKGNLIQVFMIFAIYPILMYNGKKGYSSKFSKYFFYIFYIAHIWLLIILSFII